MSSIAFGMAGLMFIGMCHAFIVLLVVRYSLGRGSHKYPLRSGLRPVLVKGRRVARGAIVHFALAINAYLLFGILSIGLYSLELLVMTVIAAIPGVLALKRWSVHTYRLFKDRRTARREYLEYYIPHEDVRADIDAKIIAEMSRP